MSGVTGVCVLRVGVLAADITVPTVSICIAIVPEMEESLVFEVGSKIGAEIRFLNL